MGGPCSGVPSCVALGRWLGRLALWSEPLLPVSWPLCLCVEWGGPGQRCRRASVGPGIPPRGLRCGRCCHSAAGTARPRPAPSHPVVPSARSGQRLLGHRGYLSAVLGPGWSSSSSSSSPSFSGFWTHCGSAHGPRASQLCHVCGSAWAWYGWLSNGKGV